MKILIVNNNMHVGGIQNALINLLQELSKNDSYDVTLCVLGNIGDQLDAVPSNIKLISGNRFTKILGLSQAEAKRDGLFTWLWRSAFAVLTKLFGTRLTYGILSHMQKINEHYDVAVSFMQNDKFNVFYGGCNEFVLNAVDADLKTSFVHCAFTDYTGKNHYNAEIYTKFDRIAGVSKSQAERFKRKCPDVPADKVYAVHNCYDIDSTLRKAEEYEVSVNADVINIFSPVRICEEKGVLRMIPIFARLKEQGFKFCWRVAGWGPLYEEAIALRDKYQMQDEIEFLGHLTNPYPYFKKSDLLLLPSFKEAAPMVYGEAEILGVPVLTTNTTSAVELVADRGIGYVCECDDDSVENALLEIMKKGKPQRLKESKLTNDLALEEFAAIISK